VHQTPPFLGQGLCAGIRDASNLAWKLELVLRGNAGEGLLESYEVERKPHVRSVVASAKEFGKIIGELDPAAAAARDKRLRAELKSGKAETIRQKFIPDLACGLIASRNKLAGKLFVQPHVRAVDGSVRRLDDLLKPQFALVTATQEAMSWMSEASLSCWQQLGGERVVIADAGKSSTRDGIATLVETDGVFSNWMRENRVSAVIVRPDRYVFAGAVNAEELNTSIENLIEALCGRP
jgi:3-(3-hydroxy-phenyl)propionate hydroxylase